MFVSIITRETYRPGASAAHKSPGGPGGKVTLATAPDGDISLSIAPLHVSLTPQTHSSLTHSLIPTRRNPPTLGCQTKAWKAEQKRECAMGQEASTDHSLALHTACVASTVAGDFPKAIEYHTQHLSITKEVGDRAEEGGAYGNLWIAYPALWDFPKAIECHTQQAIAKQAGDRSGEVRAYGNLGVCRTCSSGNSQAPGPHSYWSASTFMIKCVRRQCVSRLPSMVVKDLHDCTWHTSPHFEAGQEESALAHLKEHLSCQMQRGHAICAGVGKRGARTL